jgi:SAM-dependent methyltransferase
MDWGEGRYELIGKGLLPAAEVVVDVAAPRAGEHVVDLGCGNGNAALLAATRGARVTGIDPAISLLEAARARATERSVDATFLEGVADDMPLPDESADVIVSVFGVIFAPDASAAAREIARVAAPRGRIVLAAWQPYGALSEVSRLRREAVRRASGAPPALPPFAWHEESALRALFEPHGFEVSVSDVALPFVAPTAADFAQSEFSGHPGWVEAARVLDASRLERLQSEAVQLFADANEDVSAFRVSSDYVVATLRRA